MQIDNGYLVGPYLVIVSELADGEYHAAVFLDGVCVGSCLAPDRMALEQRAVQIAMADFTASVDNGPVKP